MMIRTLIFDLSEVLIAGLLGMEEMLAAELGVSEETVRRAYGGEMLRAICRGQLSEVEYLAQVNAQQGWTVPVERAQAAIRRNLLRRVDGMEALVTGLARRYELVLLSDHGAEWVAYIRAAHPFLAVFGTQIFSFESGRLKEEPETFRALLAGLSRAPEECLLVDDSARNVRAAAETGIRGIVFTDAARLAEELAALSVQGVA